MMLLRWGLMLSLQASSGVVVSVVRLVLDAADFPAGIRQSNKKRGKYADHDSKESCPSHCQYL